MLLDARHKPWAWSVAALLAASTAVYIPYHLLSPNGPEGGTWTGLAFGTAAFALMIVAGLLGARRRVPAWRVGRPETWMRAHLWLGLLTVPLALFHAGFKMGGTLTVVLMALLLLVTVSGIFGLVLQQFLPRLMTTRVPMETVYEQIPHVESQLLAEADALVARAAGPPPGAKPQGESGIRPPVEGAAPLRDFHASQVRPFLESAGGTGPLAAAPRAAALFASVRPVLPPALHDALGDLEVICEERRQLRVQARLHGWLHGWLLVHIPLSYSLLLLGAVHAFQSVKY